MDDTLYFYSATADFGCFSNFSSHNILLKGKLWKTSEHYFQAQKFAGTPFEEQVRATSSPGASAKLGRNKNLPLRKDWEKVKEGIMKEVLIAKFTQHEDIKKILLSTGERTLVEHTERDSYWGDGGGHGHGKNRLGYLLMEVRDVIRAMDSKKDEIIEKKEGENENEKEKENVNENEEKQKSNDEESGEDAEGEEGELEPNKNHLYEPGESAEKKGTDMKKRGGKRGGSKSKSKRGVFTDEDGSSKLEKTNEKKGSVTVIGEGTVFSEKALPPQAKFVVNKHQMQRKYHPTEKDFQDEEGEDEPTHAKPAPQQRKLMADFFKLKDEKKAKVEGEELMNAEQCLEAAKNNLEIFKEVSALGEAELLGDIRENSRKIRTELSRFIEELAEANDERLGKAMEYHEQLGAAC